MNAVYSPKIAMIIIAAKQCMETYITGCWERYVYGPVVGVMEQGISLIKSADPPTPSEKLNKTIEDLYHEANFLEQSGKPEKERAFCLIAEAMRETAAFMEQNFVINGRKGLMQ